MDMDRFLKAAQELDPKIGEKLERALSEIAELAPLPRFNIVEEQGDDKCI